MAYLTKHNSLRIVSNTELRGNNPIEGSIYKKPIYFFNNLEKTRLLYLELLFRDPESFINNYYKKIEVTDNFRYVYEGGKPAYHSSVDCDRLNSDFINFSIPEEVKNLGTDAVIRFRSTFKKYRYLLDKSDKPDVEAFCAIINAAFSIDIKPNSIIHNNSGITEVEDLNLVDLENKIDRIISLAGKFFRECDEESKKALRQFQKHTYLAYSKKDIPDNDIDMLENDLRSFLKKYDEEFKIPLKNALIEYYRVKHNPKLQFEGTLLDQLGFKPCNECCNLVIGIDEL